MRALGSTPDMSQSYLAAIGAVRIKPWAAPLFFLHAGRALRAAQTAPGCVFAGTRMHDGKAFSLTVWKSPAEMKAYAHGAGHAQAMKWAWLTATTFRFCHFQVEEPPHWDDAIARWNKMMHERGLVPAAELGHKRAFSPRSLRCPKI